MDYTEDKIDGNEEYPHSDAASASKKTLTTEATAGHSKHNAPINIVPH